MHTIDNPLQHTHVLAKPRPQKPALRVFPEPVDVKYLRRLAEQPLHLEPVPEVIAHVITAEGQHRHRITTERADAAGGGSGRLRTHRRADVHTRAPVERLIDQRHRVGTAAAEDDGADRHAFRCFPVGIDDRALRRGRGEPCVGMRRRPAVAATDFRRPPFAPPVQAFGRRLLRHAFPPHAPFGRQGHVCENRVPRDGGQGVGIRRSRRPWRDTKHTRLWIDRSQAPARVRLDPGDVVADHRHFPALHRIGRDEHRQVGFAAGTRKRRRHVGLLASRVLDAENQHVLRHPALVSRDVGGDSQSETLLSQQRIAAVA